MKIGIPWPRGDGDWLAGAIFLENLVRSICSADADCELVAIVSEGSVLPKDDLDLQIIICQSGVDARVVAFQAGIDVVFGNLNPAGPQLVPWIAWIPDFQQLHYPQFFSPSEVQARHRQFMLTAHVGTLVLLSSQDAARDYERFSPQYAHKARVASFVSHIPDKSIEREPEEVMRRHGLAHPIVVVSGQWWQHKNHMTALHAVAQVREKHSECAWVFTGSLSDHRRPTYPQEALGLVDELGIGDQVHVLGALPRDEQIQLLRASDVIVQPSLFEGWSTVVEEAKTLGQRIVLSDIGVHREQNPDNALYFKADSPDDLAAQVCLMLDGVVDRTDEDEARTASLARARAFGARFVEIAEEAQTIGVRRG